MQMRVESRLSDKGFNKMLQIMKEILPRDNIYPGSCKDVKKVLKNMGLGYETINACEHGVYYTTKSFKIMLFAQSVASQATRNVVVKARFQRRR
ncbi:hypothetical protein QQ045_019506 [Rhodiola kirilowii]